MNFSVQSLLVNDDYFFDYLLTIVSHLIVTTVLIIYLLTICLF